MPREHRKRGKKHRKQANEEQGISVPAEPEVIDEPPWIRRVPGEPIDVNGDAPFGYIDADVKAYFRTVDVQIRKWQESDCENARAEEDEDPSEGVSFQRKGHALNET